MKTENKTPCTRLPAGTPAALRLAVHRHKMVTKKEAR